MSRKCEYPPLKRRNRSFPWRHGNKNGAVVLLGFQAFQRGFIRRNWPRDDEARSKSLEEKPSVPAGGASVPAGGVNCSLYAAMELSSSFSVLGNLLRLVRNESSCSPWSFLAPSNEDLAWISNQVDPTRFFKIFHADHTCSLESRCQEIFAIVDGDQSTAVNRFTDQVGSANFSLRRIGLALDNSQNVAGAHELNVHAHFNFRFQLSGK